MKVLFRVDASVNIGTGHVMRCLTLANRLRRRDVQCAFVSRRLPGDMIEHIENQGFEVLKMPANALGSVEHDAQETISTLLRIYPNVTWDWLVVDHYGLNFHFERVLRPMVKKILVIDDLADRVHDCDVLLDQNYYEDMNSRYLGNVPSGCVQLLGPTHALLRDEFSVVNRNQKGKRTGQLKQIMISFGGSDPEKQTMAAIAAVKLSPQCANTHLNVVLGQSNPDLRQIEDELSGDPQITLHVQTQKIADLMNEADLCIGAGGTTVWERLFLGLPTIAVATAENQVRTLQDIAKLGLIYYLGPSAEVGIETYIQAILQITGNPTTVQTMSDNSKTFMKSSSIGIEQLMLSAL